MMRDLRSPRAVRILWSEMFIGRVIFQWAVPQHLGTLWRSGCPSFGMKDVSFPQKGVPRQKCSAPSLSRERKTMENFFPYHETCFFTQYHLRYDDLMFIHALVVLTIDIGKFFLGNTSWKATAFRRTGSCRIWTFRRKCPSFWLNSQARQSVIFLRENADGNR